MQTQTKYSKNPTTITGLTVTGSLVNMNKLNNPTKLGASTINLVNILEQQKLADGIKSKIANITDETKKNQTINDEINKSLPAEVKAQLSQAPKLETLSQEQIKTIDLLSKTDISGNKFVNIEEIKTKANLNNIQAQEVVKALNNFNKLPEELKDGSNTSTQSTVNTATAKEVEKNEASTLEKVASWVGEFGTSVNAKAACDQTLSGSKWYWGVSVSANGCGWQALKIFSYGIISQKLLWAWACSTISFGLCTAILGVLSILIFFLSTQAGRGVDVASVCSSKRATISLGIAPSVQFFGVSCG